jgi:hypothetical protein
MYAHVRSLFRMNRLICVQGTSQPGSRGIYERGGSRFCGVAGSDCSGKATRRQSVVLPGFMRSGVLHSTVGHCGVHILLRPHHLGACTDCTGRMGLVYLGFHKFLGWHEDRTTTYSSCRISSAAFLLCASMDDSDTMIAASMSFVCHMNVHSSCLLCVSRNYMHSPEIFSGAPASFW